MTWYTSPVDLIGDTPLVQLDRMTGNSDVTLLAKLEFLNPGGSVKDRITLRMIEAAERDGTLRPGGTIVEPTSGNTGVGLAMIAARRGYRCVFTCPDKVSEEKRNVLRALGAELVVCPAAVPIDHPSSYRSVSDRIAAETPGAVKLDQYSNPANPDAHYHSTGPELWKQTNGRLTHFVASVGTGGTITGTGRYLREVSGDSVRVIGADPDGSIYSGGGGRPYLLEGVGQPAFPQSFDPSVPHEIIAITDAESISITRRLAREEGLLVGGSAGLAVAAALRVVQQAEAGALVVALLPDSGRGYLSKIFSDEWLQRHGLADPVDGPQVADVLGDQALEFISPLTPLESAIARLTAGGLSHLLVASAPPPVRLAELTGVLSEEGLARTLASRDEPAGRLTVADVMQPPPPPVGLGQALDTAVAVVGGHGAATVLDGGLVHGLLTARSVIANHSRIGISNTVPSGEQL